MIVAVHQPSFAPWTGFFDKVDRSDVFVLLDNVQFKKNEWQNRNRIKSPNGLQWLTVPVSYRFGEKIRNVPISSDGRWQSRHLKTLRTCYGRAPYFDATYAAYETLVGRPWDILADFNIALLMELFQLIGISKEIVLASDLEPLPDDRDGRLIEICHKMKAKRYLAGAGGRDYMDLPRYRSSGLEVSFQSYEPSSYTQLFGAFEPNLSILDVLFNCGPSTLDVIRQGRSN